MKITIHEGQAHKPFAKCYYLVITLQPNDREQKIMITGFEYRTLKAMGIPETE